MIAGIYESGMTLSFYSLQILYLISLLTLFIILVHGYVRGWETVCCVPKEILHHIWVHDLGQEFSYAVAMIAALGIGTILLSLTWPVSLPIVGFLVYRKYNTIYRN